MLRRIRLSSVILIALVVTVAATVRADDDYDPLEGMDPDGRIQKVDKAALVEHPERWRYLPESRIPPGNVLDRFLVSSLVFPVVFFSSDVGAGFGAGITDLDWRDQRRREFLGVFASYSTEGQQSYNLGWRRWLKQVDVPSGGVLQEERSFVRLSGGYRNTLSRGASSGSAPTRASTTRPATPTRRSGSTAASRTPSKVRSRTSSCRSGSLRSGTGSPAATWTACRIPTSPPTR